MQSLSVIQAAFYGVAIVVAIVGAAALLRIAQDISAIDRRLQELGRKSDRPQTPLSAADPSIATAAEQ